MEEVTGNKEEAKRPPHRFQPGQSGNPSGRPKDTLKAFVSKQFREMNEEQKEEWLKTHHIPGELIWRMGEGNPTNELTGKDGGAIEIESDVTISLVQKQLDELYKGGHIQLDGNSPVNVDKEIQSKE